MAAVAASLIPELEEVVSSGSPAKRAETLRRITSLFLEGADRFADAHVLLFDQIIGCLIDEIESKALAELTRRIAPVPNAPPEVVSQLARNDDIAVAGPLLQQARLDDRDLRFIAETKGQAHLLALSTRLGINEALSDILVSRGNREVARSLANNEQARLSDGAFAVLVKRATDDSQLAEKVGLRSDIPARLFRQLLIQATEVVQKRLLAAAKPETQLEIRRVLAKISDEVGAKVTPRSYGAAMATVRGLHQERKLGEVDIVQFAKAGKYEETIAALATVSAVPVEVVDRLMSGERYDPVLILSCAAGFSWDTARAIITAQPGARGTSTQAIEEAKENFDRLTPATAQRVVRFWQVRQGND